MPKPVANCSFCRTSLFMGETVIIAEGNYYCVDCDPLEGDVRTILTEEGACKDCGRHVGETVLQKASWIGTTQMEKVCICDSCLAKYTPENMQDVKSSIQTNMDILDNM